MCKNILIMSPTLIQTKQGPKPIDTQKIMDSLIFASKGLSRVDIFKVYQQTIASIHDGITTDEINILTTKSASSFITEHYEYSYLGGNLICQQIYKEVFGESMYEYDDFYSHRYTNHFEKYLNIGIEFGLLNPNLRDFDLNEIKEAIKPERDRKFKESGIGRVYKQYLLRTNDNELKVFELPQFWFMRVAMGLCLQEPKETRTKTAIEYYNALSNFHILCATPTLLNSGKVRSQLSSCFLLTVQDDLKNIYKTYADISQLSKYAGGIGVDFTNIRATGSLIKGTNGKSLGLIPFLKVMDASTAAVNQGGSRKGSTAVYLEVWHTDFPDFLSCKYVSVDENRRCPNINTAAWIPDLFMKRLISKNDKWTLFSPSDVPELHSLYGKEFETKYEEYENNPAIPKQVISLRKIWEEMITSLLGKGFGHPWITFKDPSNACNPQKHIGPIYGSNLCTEILLPTNENEHAVCNLSHLNLATFVKDNKIDYEGIAHCTKLLVRILNNVIDNNFYATQESERSNKQHRAIGLGTFGLQTLVQKIGIAIESDKFVELNDKIYEFIHYTALSESSELATKYGKYPSFEGSSWSKGIMHIDAYRQHIKDRGVESTNELEIESMNWDLLREKIKTDGLQNSQVMMIAPNRSTSYIVGSSPSIEPWDSNIFTEVGISGKYTLINNELVDALDKISLWTPAVISKIKQSEGSIQNISEIPEDIRQIFKTAYELHPKWLISANARRQKWIDMSISFNQWINSTNGSDVERMYIECWKAGLKATYYLHSRSGSQDKRQASEVVPEVIQKEEKDFVCDMTDPNCEMCQ
jgi:ribonucleoside-diphosphate reductase alpha chain